MVFLILSWLSPEAGREADATVSNKVKSISGESSSAPRLGENPGDQLGASCIHQSACLIQHNSYFALLGGDIITAAKSTAGKASSKM